MVDVSFWMAGGAVMGRGSGKRGAGVLFQFLGSGAVLFVLGLQGQDVCEGSKVFVYLCRYILRIPFLGFTGTLLSTMVFSNLFFLNFSLFFFFFWKITVDENLT